MLSLLIAYPIAYFLAFKARPAATRIVLLLFTVPFLVNYIIRTFAWTYLLGRTGPVNAPARSRRPHRRPGRLAALQRLRRPRRADHLLHAVHDLPDVDVARRHRPAPDPGELGARRDRRPRTFFKVTLPLSLPGIFAAAIFGFVGCFGESAVPVIMGGVGYQLMGNTITSTMDVLNYPLAAAMSSVVVLAMIVLLASWYLAFDMRSFLGKILNWRA